MVPIHHSNYYSGASVIQDQNAKCNILTLGHMSLHTTARRHIIHMNQAGDLAPAAASADFFSASRSACDSSRPLASRSCRSL